MPSILIRSRGVIDHHGDLIGDSLLVEDGVVRGLGKAPGYVTEIRLDGYILPGFVDAHLHVKGLGTSLYGADLRWARSPEEVAERLAAVKGPLAVGRGWDQEAFENPKLPDRRLLDKYVPDRPAVAIRVCGHLAVLNTRALEEVEPWRLYPSHVDRESGILVEDAVYYAVNKLLDKLDNKELVKLGLESLHSAGVVGASSMACSDSEIKSLYSIARSSGLPVRIACYANKENYKSHLGLEAPRFKVVGVKLFSDGSFGARTAALRDDYEDDSGNRGRLLLTSRDIAEIGSYALKAGYRIAVHAIGDRALDEVIEAYNRISPGAKGRVEHASMAWDSQVEELASLGVYVVVQPRFRVSDWWLAQRLGGRVGLAYRFKTMLDRGVRLALSTDAPVEDHRPWSTMLAAIGDCGARRCGIGEDLSPRDAIRLYTIEAARASGGPVAALGRIEPGAPGELAWSPGDPRERGWKGPVRPLDLAR